MSDKVCMLMAVQDPGSYINVAKVLSKNAFNINMLCLGHKSQPQKEQLQDGVFLERLRSDGIFASPFRAILNPLTGLKFLIRSNREKADVYWGNSFAFLPILMVLKLFKKKVIYDVSDDDPSNFSYAIRRYYHLGLVANLAELMFRSFEKFCIKRMDYVITLTESLKKDRALYTSHIKAIYYCLDSSFSALNFDQSTFEKFKDQDVIVYSGTIELKKCIREILQAFDLVKEEDRKAIMVMAGGFADFDKEEIQKLIAGRNDIYITGRLSYSDMPKYITLGKVGLAMVTPANYSYKISLPFKVIEQMACGLPIIAPSGLPEVEKIVNESRCGLLVDANDPKQIANAILRLLNDNQIREKMSSNALDYIKSHHSLDIFEKETVQVFREVLRGDE